MAQKIAVLGAGTMGAGIAQLAAQNGFDVLLYDVKDEFVQRGLGNIKKSLQGRVDKGKLSSEEMDAAASRLRATTKRDEAADADFIIEAAPEDLDLKREIFSSLSEKASAETLLLTNTSSLSVTSIASAAKRPECVAGMHFFNPAPAMALVEVVAGSRTSPDVVQTVAKLARDLGKLPVIVADMPGFIVNRVARPFYGEALKIVGEGTATVLQVDEAMRGAGFRMGPFELMDFIGIDINFAVTHSVFEAFFGEPRYRPHPIQQRMVEAGTLGQKSGSGFYRYAGKKRLDPLTPMFSTFQHHGSTSFLTPVLLSTFLEKAGIEQVPELEAHAEIVTRILAMIMNEAAFAVGEGVASVRDIDRAMKLGTNYPKGPLRWADEVGLEVVLEVLRSLQAKQGEERYRPAPVLRRLVEAGITGDAVGEGFHSPGEKGMV
ncbi:MAG: 3-hydroxyacyl-CoA dehydrogenase NAD-binding domain-containing protein [Chloroflexia bacterium]